MNQAGCLNLVTNGDNNSWGFRNATTFGRDNEAQITAGWDFRYTSQALNEFDTFFRQLRRRHSAKREIRPGHSRGLLREGLGDDAVVDNPPER